ncbi:Uncharacterized protein APZ42_019101 [Daphnia magna]|uniref:Uncharacterized protein n=1 Tax=Daphnia magna TaxID=35525 RepID=A0A164YM60_9CRUS|nr:Uncharacterized protein APZ42_019101 [Daphnia magna]
MADCKSRGRPKSYSHVIISRSSSIKQNIFQGQEIQADRLASFLNVCISIPKLGTNVFPVINNFCKHRLLSNLVNKYEFACCLPIV